MDLKLIAKPNRFLYVLIAGDLAVLALVTVAGFATHQTLGTAGFRLLTTFVPLTVAWGLVGVPLGVFDIQRVRDRRQWWRPFWGMALAAPWLGLLRAWLSGAPTITVAFVVVVGGVAALALLIWRLLFTLFMAPRFAGG